MVARVTAIAIAVGGACGALAALVGAPAPSLSPRETARVSGERPKGNPSPNTSAPPSSSAPSSSSAPAASAKAISDTPSASSSSSVEQALSQAPPTTPRALLRAEMRCDQKDAAGCERAALGYELGTAGPADPEKAANYRKIGLTLWMVQCDHNSPTACATLAELYRAGRGVPQSEKIATALVTRTRELCRYNDVPACHSLPNP